MMQTNKCEGVCNQFYFAKLHSSVEEHKTGWGLINLYFIRSLLSLNPVKQVRSFAVNANIRKDVNRINDYTNAEQQN